MAWAASPLAGSEVYLLSTPKAANLDETKIPPYRESDPLILPTGVKLSHHNAMGKDTAPVRPSAV